MAGLMIATEFSTETFPHFLLSDHHHHHHHHLLLHHHHLHHHHIIFFIIIFFFFFFIIIIIIIIFFIFIFIIIIIIIFFFIIIIIVIIIFFFFIIIIIIFFFFFFFFIIIFSFFFFFSRALCRLLCSGIDPLPSLQVVCHLIRRYPRLCVCDYEHLIFLRRVTRPPAKPPFLEDQFVSLSPASLLRPVQLGRPYQEHKAPAGIARKVIEVRKHPQHDKVEIFGGGATERYIAFIA
jgi:hypothetical protein